MTPTFTLSTNKDQVEQYLKNQKILEHDELIEKIESAGEGNMNLTLRIQTNLRSFIAKQSFNFVYKYPHVPAPVKRIEMEYAFYKANTNNARVLSASPKTFFLDSSNNIMLMEDLGKASDYLSIYKKGASMSKNDIDSLLEYILALHKSSPLTQEKNRIENREMRLLNHHHIFEFPFNENNDFNLDDVQNGLQNIAIKYKKDTVLKSAIEIIGDKYLNDNGTVLLHGDFYPGSWMHNQKNIKVIDTEFCFHGFAEFDLGVMLAHMYLAEQSENIIDKIKIIYTKSLKIDDKLCDKIIGVEIMRRLIGLAQLPLSLSLSSKSEMLEKAKKLILSSQNL